MEPFAFATKSGSVVLHNILDKFAIKSAGEESQQLSEDMFNYTDSDGLKKPLYPPGMLAHLAEMNTYHAVCVKTKATDVGGLGYKIAPNAENPNPENKKKLETFFQACIPLFEDIATYEQMDKGSIGWGVLELIRTGNVVKGLPLRFDHIPSHTIRIHKDKNKFAQTWDGVHKTWFKRIGYDKDVNRTNGEESELGSLTPDLRAHEIIYDVNYTPLSTYYGIPDSIPVIRTIIGDQAAVDYNIAFFKNFGVPAYAIYVVGEFADEPLLDTDGKPTGKSKMQDAMERKFKEVLENPHGSMVFMIPTTNPDTKVEVTFEKLSVDVKESSFRLYRQDNRDEIIAAHRMDPYRINAGRTGSLGGNTSVETKKNYKTGVAKPEQRRLEAFINIKVIWAENGFNIQDWKLQLEEIDTEDESHEMEMDNKLFLMGARRPIDLIKKWENKTGITVPKELEDHPALNAYYVNNYPITTDHSNVPVEVAKILDDLADKLEGGSKRWIP